MKHGLLYAVLATTVVIMAHCTTSPLAGGGTETTNGYVVGKVTDNTGAPVKNAQLRLYKQDYNPVVDTLTSPNQADTSDSLGHYRIAALPGTYSLLVKDPHTLNRAYQSSIIVEKDTFFTASPVMRIPGAIKVFLADTLDTLNGYVYIEGTDRSALIRSNRGYVVIDSVAEGEMPPVRLGMKNSPRLPRVLGSAVRVVSGDTSVVMYYLWPSSASVFLNTSSTGANIAGNVYNFPLLVRLTNDNFKFEQVKSGGGEVRFSKIDNSPVSFEIERWDSAAGEAIVWVKLDTVRGSDTTQQLKMYWGASASSVTAALTSSTTVFDTGAGFQGVWHLSEAGNTSAFDATVNRFNGTPYGMTAESSVSGMIGAARKFDGATSFIQIIGSAKGKMDFPESGSYSVSAWVCADSPATHPELIVGKGHSQYYLRMNYYTLNSYWEFVEYHDLDKQQNITDVPAMPASFAWKYLVGIRDGAKQRLYLNGELVMDTTRFHAYNNGITARDTGFDITIGKHLQPFAAEGDCFFKGIIDEVRIENVARSSDWIKLCYLNQQADSKVVTVR